MKTIKINVNKTEEQPEGIEIEVVEPDNDLEKRVLGFLLTGFVRDTKSRGVLKLDLPDNFAVSYEREGSFIVADGPRTPNLGGKVHTYYTPSKPLAVMAIHSVGGRLDVVYGELGKRKPGAPAAPAAPAAAEAEAAPVAVEAEAAPATDEAPAASAD